MAFPTVAGITTDVSGPSTTHNVAMPATVNAGDLLIVMASKGLAANATITTPAGWTIITSRSTGAQAERTASYYKIAAGTEGGTTVNFATGDSCGLACRIYRITVWHGVTPPEGVDAASASGDPPTVTPSWGSDDNLYIAYFGWSVSSLTPSAGPSGYSNFGTTVAVNSGNDRGRITTADLNATSSSENPGVFTGGTTNSVVTGTIAVRPALVLGHPTTKRHAGVAFTTAHAGRASRVAVY